MSKARAQRRVGIRPSASVINSRNAQRSVLKERVMTTALVPANGTHFDTFDVSGTSVQLLWTDTTPTVVAKHLCEQFGLSWSRQAKVLKDPNGGFSCGLTAMTGADGKTYEMLSLSVADAVRWIMGITPAKVATMARERLEAFQRGFLPALISRIEDHWRRKVDIAVHTASHNVLRAMRADRALGYVHLAALKGLDFASIEAMRPVSWPRRRVLEAAHELYVSGTIDRLPAGTPPLPASRAPDRVARTSQLDMFAGA